MTYQTMCALRIYLRRGDLSQATGFWQRMFRKPLATQLIHEALRAGITHASLTYGNIGFARGAKLISADTSDIPFDTLPVSVELVAPKPMLDQFVRDRAKQLQEATLVMLEGVHVRSMVAGEDAPTGRGKVEYVRVASSPESVNTLAEEVHAALGSVPPPAAEG